MAPWRQRLAGDLAGSSTTQKRPDRVGAPQRSGRIFRF